MSKSKTRARYLLAFVAAAILALAMAVPAFAAGANTITVEDTHKGQVYKLYKIFDATTVEGRTATAEDGISYKLMSGKTDLKATVNGSQVDGAQWFTIDDQGNITIKDDTAKAAINSKNADFRAWAEAYGAQVEPAAGKEAASDGAAVEYANLEDGYYFMTTTTGSLISVDSVAPNVTIKDKNAGTEIDKKITGVADGSVDAEGSNALAQVGTTVSYESRINIKEGAYNYKFTDTMTKGLTLNASSVKVYLVDKGAQVADGASNVNSACGTITAANAVDENTADITIAFGDAWLKTNEGKDIVIQYSATVNKDAVISGTVGNPNTAKIEYGNTEKPLTSEDTVQVFSAKITVTKVDGDNKPLEGAGFKLKNKDGKFYKLTEGIVSWVSDEAEATEVEPVRAEIDNPDYDASDPESPEKVKSGDAVAEFSGLANGEYTLIESKVPAGYNKAADKVITILEKNVTVSNTSKAETVTNNSGVELPSTGGMGTTILYIIGGILVLGAVVYLITKRRMAKTNIKSDDLM